MLLATSMERVFILEEKGEQVFLPDPNPRWSEQAVLNYYAPTYPALTTAKVSAPVFRDDTVQYKFESVMGTKG